MISLSTDREGPIIDDCHWLTDSSGVVFLERIAGGARRLVLADLRKRNVLPLTSATGVYKAFDVRDRKHYVYVLADSAEQKRSRAERRAPAIVATGRSLFPLLWPDDPNMLILAASLNRLWAVVGGKPFEIKHNGKPVVPGRDVALSPDGQSVVTALPVLEVPKSWETLYPPRLASFPYRIRAGHLDIGSGTISVSQYVRISLKTGAIHPLTDAPISNDAGWWSAASPSWSSDGQAVLLPGTFLKQEQTVPSRPCIAIVDFTSHTRTCIETMKGQSEAGVEGDYGAIKDARFIKGDKDHVLVSFYNAKNNSVQSIMYLRVSDGSWHADREKGVEDEGTNHGLEVSIRQGLDESPRLVVKDKHASRVLWNPNPKLRKIELAEANIYTWKDKEGRDWRGGLYKPVNYKSGQRYPLVIQTHGFSDAKFRPSGLSTTAFAARALAAAGIVVLQVADLGDHCPAALPSEGPCAVGGYESAVSQLVTDGLVDPERVGILGFSRTCFYVMEALTTGSLHFKAASVVDGAMFTYLEYMVTEDWFGNAFANEADSIMGAPPFRDGLQQWLQRSPGFNFDKITAPVLITGISPSGLLLAWEPYAALRYLHKPVDLMMLNSDQHVLTNPAVRLASQGGTVDWFRFWLKGEEDFDSTKAAQYARWRDLRELQKLNHNQAEAPAAPTTLPIPPNSVDK
jgi:dipeptidyl aminopeptidase/acylaminoacyl peptidase